MSEFRIAEAGVVVLCCCLRRAVIRVQLHLSLGDHTMGHLGRLLFSLYEMQSG
jgi:hypothetical protein